MMKLLICVLLFLLSFIFSTSCFSQTENECQKGIDSAKVHIEKGEYEYKIYGTSISNYQTFSRLLHEKYSIKVSYDIGCLVFEKEECYSNYMNKKTREKFGSTIIEKTWQKAKYMDSVGLGDRSAVFEAGNDKINEFIYSNLNWYKLDFYKNKDQNKEDKKYRVYAKTHIDTLGNVKVDSVFRINSLEVRQEIKRVIELLPKWKTATKDGKVIEQMLLIPLFFSEEIRKKYDTR